jgi:hypothetical protein
MRHTIVFCFIWTVVHATCLLYTEHTAALLSLDAYKNSNIAIIADWQILAFFSAQHINTKVYVNHKLKMVAVAYRGSEHYDDWLTTNVNWQLIPCILEGIWFGKVHAGFYGEYIYDSARVLATIRKYIAQHYRILYTGHSQGGGIATIGALHVSLLYPNSNLSLITFGAPRVGDSDFNIHLVEQVPNRRRIVQTFTGALNYHGFELALTQDELVSTLPPANLGYEHAPGQVIRLKCNVKEYPALECHRMSNYIQGMKHYNGDALNNDAVLPSIVDLVGELAQMFIK